MMSKTDNRQEVADFKQLISHIIEETKRIDQSTIAVNGSMLEPDWWCDMMDLQRLACGLSGKWQAADRPEVE